MNVYMIEDTSSGLFYRKHLYRWWVPQKDASIWTSKRGPGQVVKVAYRMKDTTPMIRTYKLESTDE